MWLSVPYEHKEQAKQLGARWDPDVRQWWVRPESSREVREHAPTWLQGGSFSLSVEGALFLVRNEATCPGCQRLTVVFALLAQGVREFFIYDDGEEWGQSDPSPVFLSGLQRIASTSLREELAHRCPAYRSGPYNVYRNHCPSCAHPFHEDHELFSPQGVLVPPEHGPLHAMSALRLRVPLPTYVDAGLLYLYSNRIDLFSRLLRGA